MSVWAAWILHGRSRSVLFISATGLLSQLILPFGLLSGGAITLVALRNRFPEIAGVLVAACGICAVFLWAAVGKAGFALQLLLFWVLAALAGILLRRSSNLALAMLVPALAGLSVVAFIYTAFPEPVDLWKQVLVQSGQILGLEPDMPGFTEVVAQRARLMTGLVAAAVMVGMSACLLLGRWWQSSLYNPGAFGREFRNLRFGRAITLVNVGLYALFLWSGSELVLSVLCVLAAMYALQGLSLAHAFARARALNILAVTIFYVILLLSVYAKLLLSILGMVDAWVDGRRRWLGGASSA
ncbi:MAG TPA: hypothetical protein VFX02_12055 [Gammaproteobacteria bacterium]|nr:hypothetical protein [Gammaproteobacteria bacterium]